MSDLLFLRHAKSDWDASYARDFDRPLNERGERAAEAMGRFLDTQPAIDRVLASPALRVAETLERIGRHCASLPQPQWVGDLYGASIDRVVALARGMDEGVGRLLVAGHNPTTHSVAATLARDDGSDDYDDLLGKYPTGALVELSFEHWRDVRAENGRLVRFVKPRDLEG